jgi:transposase InsO family protein
VKIFRDEVFKHHGLPRKVISDRGPQYVSKFMMDLYSLLGIKGNPSTAFHSQTDGQTERINREVEQYLRIWVNYTQDDWSEWLSITEFTYNNCDTTSTDYSPFYLNHGHHPWTRLTKKQRSNNETADQFITRMKELGEQATKALEKANSQMKKQFDKHHQPLCEYSIGDKVWLEATNLKTKRPTKKMDNK